jgi:hypothetical protein
MWIIIDETEFVKRLSENKDIEDCNERIAYRMPVVQHFITHYSKGLIQVKANGMISTVRSSDMIINFFDASNTEAYTTMNTAFNEIVSMFTKPKEETIKPEPEQEKDKVSE